MDLRVVPYDDPDARKLIAEVQQEYVVRYGEPDITPVDPAEFAPPQGLFVIGFLDEVPVACGGWRAHDHDAEIKRMYVVASARGNGFARGVLAELERTAAVAGHSRVVLETGTMQPEAISLYRSSGYREILAFGVYKDSADCVCFAKDLSR
ncbi:MAG TPA: GNAT family N-acetyltransferase [Amycolatopsis sp.]|uniref:GNAT family N-acetyltransferase n=1 Tax=Amycolatopsis sp. TaxID=37632 RepID=UPI002B467711|nr:GNAT family N-acetyltransferase [Amycolatopsis sp.]HKS44032.1 GNAT family N-acetyltransferase [Amycolatopsis sp.]